MTTFMKEFEHLKIHLEEVKRATGNFDKSKVIGSGGFGTVFKGEVSHSKGQSIVAIKRLNRKYGQGDPEFLKEIMMLSRYMHRNLISLLGFCDEGDEKILVYEHASNGSLDRYLGDPSLTWTQRLNICLGAAKGLSYLHDPNGSYQRVLHCDIKSSNILLDENLNAKVADFGLAKMGPANQPNTVLLTNAIGTPGYCDPQYMMAYTLTKESDVYSFGVVLFEVLCGKLCFQISNGRLKVSVPMWKKCYTEKKLDKIIFQDLLMQEMDPTSLETFSNIAFECLYEYREERPTMSLVVEKLELALKSQKPNGVKLYEKILEAAVDPLVYRSVEELKVLLSKGLFLNKGQTWFSLNDKGFHHVMISIDSLASYKGGDYRSRYSHDYNSRFKVGTYNTCGKSFSIRGRFGSEFLSPGITYMVNLVFKYPDIFKKKQTGKQAYIAITYILKGEEEKRSSIVHIGDKREDEWLMVGLYHFTTTTNNNQSSNNTIQDLRIHFEDHEYWKGGLEIEGIEFQPLENVKFEDDDQILIDEYRDILEAAAYPHLFYRSVQELKLLLSKGLFLNEGQTWFYLNDNGQHCEMISIAECLIPDAGIDYSYSSDYNSRFKVGSLNNWKCKFRTRVRTQFLSLNITYSVNLVFKFHQLFDKDNTVKQCSIGLKYKLDGKTKTWISYLANKREDNWWMVELCQFTSDGKTFDLEISFEGFESEMRVVEEGIEFQPPEKAAKYQVLEAEIEKEVNMQPPISDSDNTYWEQKLPNDYKDIIKCSKNNLQWTAKKELHSILCKGFLINNGHETLVRIWKESYKHKNLDGIIFQDMKQQMDPASLETFSNIAYQCLQKSYEQRPTMSHIVEKLEFALKLQEIFEEQKKIKYYENMIKNAITLVFHTSQVELNMLLSDGIHFSDCKTWFSIDKNGTRCEMISAAECLIPSLNQFENIQYKCVPTENARFVMNDYQALDGKFKIRVKPQFLIPKITYTVNLVFQCLKALKEQKYGSPKYELDVALGKLKYVTLKYTSEGETRDWISYLADRRDDGWLTVELYEFTSDSRDIELELSVEPTYYYPSFPIVVEGIEFRHVDREGNEVLEEKKEDMQLKSYSDTDIYWEQKLPYDYEKIIKWSKNPFQWSTKKELYTILCKGFLINNGKEWFSLAKNGKKCYMLPSSSVLINVEGKYYFLPESRLFMPDVFCRFEEVVCYKNLRRFSIVCRIKSDILSPETTYVAYIVYNFPMNHSGYKAPVMLKEKDFHLSDNETFDFQIIYLVSPQTPVLRLNSDQNTPKPLNRPKRKGIPQLRNDGWMEVQVWEFQTATTIEIIPMRVDLITCYHGTIAEIIVQGIEFRPE